MPCTLNKAAWEKLIDEDVEWLDFQPDTLECKHIRQILEWVKKHKPDKQVERIKELEVALDLCGRLRQDDHKKAINELVTTRQYLTGRIKEFEGVIEAALRISDLWTLNEVETMFEDEAKALETMKTNFEKVLHKPCSKKKEGK